MKTIKTLFASTLLFFPHYAQAADCELEKYDRYTWKKTVFSAITAEERDDSLTVEVMECLEQPCWQDTAIIEKSPHVRGKNISHEGQMHVWLVKGNEGSNTYHILDCTTPFEDYEAK